MAKYKTVFVFGQYADIPVQEPGWRMVEAIVRFPHVARHPSYWQVRPDKDSEPVCAVLFDLDKLTFGSRTPWDGRLIASDGKWVSEAARELARLIRDESEPLDLTRYHF
jgi:hypothetical protein